MKNLRMSTPTDMTIHWKALSLEHFLIRSFYGEKINILNFTDLTLVTESTL
jgi:hypothetical protein